MLCCDAHAVLAVLLTGGGQGQGGPAAAHMLTLPLLA
jgi:hypothetical protein